MRSLLFSTFEIFTLIHYSNFLLVCALFTLTFVCSQASMNFLINSFVILTHASIEKTS